MADNIRAVQNFRTTPDESAEVRKRAIVGAGVYTGTMPEYWKKAPDTRPGEAWRPGPVARSTTLVIRRHRGDAQDVDVDPISLV